jgi:hypothetical protein
MGGSKLGVYVEGLNLCGEALEAINFHILCSGGKFPLMGAGGPLDSDVGPNNYL